MPNISDRIAAKEQVKAVLEAVLDVPVFYNDHGPEDGDPDEAVYLGRIRGEVATAALSQSETGTDDAYTIESGILVRTEAGEIDADRRAQQILTAIYAALFASPRLNRAPNPLPAVRTSPGRCDGPTSSPTDGTTCVSVVLFDLEFTCPVRGS